MPLVDTHAHLDEPAFDADRQQVIERARAAGVETVIAVATTAASSEQTVALAATFSGVFATVGIHPNYAAQAEAGDWDRIVALTGSPRVVALGETGLDRRWDYTPWDVQTDYFNRHLELSRATGLPFIVHCRDCEADIMAALGAAHAQGPLRGVMHSFTGDALMAEECLAMGLYISFAGMVTFKKSDELRAVAATIPEDRILVETDSPYLSPHPLRGKRNEPAHVVHTARCLAELRGQTVDEFIATTTANARRLFGLSAE